MFNNHGALQPMSCTIFTYRGQENYLHTHAATLQFCGTGRTILPAPKPKTLSLQVFHHSIIPGMDVQFFVNAPDMKPHAIDAQA